MHKKIIIAIDGPSGSGKSSSAKILAKKLNYNYIDTGAMYRAITLWWLNNNKPNDEEFEKEVDSISIDLKIVDFTQKTFLNNLDVSDEIRSVEVSNNVSYVSSLGFVRNKLLLLQQNLGEKGGVVMDGRDIATAVFPNAELKIYLTASVETRAKRRHLELKESGVEISLLEVQNDISKRDLFDTKRELNPLRKADDAILLDTSDFSFDEQIEKLYELSLSYINN